MSVTNSISLGESFTESSTLFKGTMATILMAGLIYVLYNSKVLFEIAAMGAILGVSALAGAKAFGIIQDGTVSSASAMMHGLVDGYDKAWENLSERRAKRTQAAATPAPAPVQAHAPAPTAPPVAVPVPVPASQTEPVVKFTTYIDWNVRRATGETQAEVRFGEVTLPLAHDPSKSWWKLQVTDLDWAEGNYRGELWVDGTKQTNTRTSSAGTSFTNGVATIPAKHPAA